jgi:hypothetical protein
MIARGKWVSMMRASHAAFKSASPAASREVDFISRLGPSTPARRNATGKQNLALAFAQDDGRLKIAHFVAGNTRPTIPLRFHKNAS